MKKSKKFVLAGLFLLAAIITGLTLTGCETEVDPSTPQQEQTDGNTGNSGGGNTQQPSGDNSGNEDEVGGEKPVTYTVTFNANGGAFADESTTKPETVEINDRVLRPEPDPTKTDYGFGGWYTSTNDGTTLADTAYDFEAGVTQDTTLYAKWGEEVASVQTADRTITYDTFDSALAAAMNSTGSTLTLLADISGFSEIIVSKGDFTLDLNGKSINIEGPIYIKAEVSLTIKDSVGNGKIEHKIADISFNDGKITMYGGYITNLKNFGTLEMYGGTFVPVDLSLDGTIVMHGGTIADEATTSSIFGELTMYDGTIYNMVVDGGEVNLYGGQAKAEVASYSGTCRMKGEPIIDTPYDGFIFIEKGFYITLVGELTGESPYKLVPRNYVAGDIVVQGEGYTITESDCAMFTVEGKVLELDTEKNAIILKDSQ